MEESNYKLVIHIKNNTTAPIHNKLTCKIQINDIIKTVRYPFKNPQEFQINHISNTSILKLTFDYNNSQLGKVIVNLPSDVENLQEYEITKDISYFLPNDALKREFKANYLIMILNKKLHEKQQERQNKIQRSVSIQSLKTTRSQHKIKQQQIQQQQNSIKKQRSLSQIQFSQSNKATNSILKKSDLSKFNSVNAKVRHFSNPINYNSLQQSQSQGKLQKNIQEKRSVSPSYIDRKQRFYEIQNQKSLSRKQSPNFTSQRNSSIKKSPKFQQFEEQQEQLSQNLQEIKEIDNQQQQYYNNYNFQSQFYTPDSIQKYDQHNFNYVNKNNNNTSNISPQKHVSSLKIPQNSQNQDVFQENQSSEIKVEDFQQKEGETENPLLETQFYKNEMQKLRKDYENAILILDTKILTLEKNQIEFKQRENQQNEINNQNLITIQTLQAKLQEDELILSQKNQEILQLRDQLELEKIKNEQQFLHLQKINDSKDREIQELNRQIQLFTQKNNQIQVSNINQQNSLVKQTSQISEIQKNSQLISRSNSNQLSPVKQKSSLQKSSSFNQNQQQIVNDVDLILKQYFEKQENSNLKRYQHLFQKLNNSDSKKPDFNSYKFGNIEKPVILEQNHGEIFILHQQTLYTILDFLEKYGPEQKIDNNNLQKSQEILQQQQIQDEQLNINLNNVSQNSSQMSFSPTKQQKFKIIENTEFNTENQENLDQKQNKNNILQKTDSFQISNSLFQGTETLKYSDFDDTQKSNLVKQHSHQFQNIHGSQDFQPTTSRQSFNDIKKSQISNNISKNQNQEYLSQLVQFKDQQQNLQYQNYLESQKLNEVKTSQINSLNSQIQELKQSQNINQAERDTKSQIKGQRYSKIVTTLTPIISRDTSASKNKSRESLTHSINKNSYYNNNINKSYSGNSSISNQDKYQNKQNYCLPKNYSLQNCSIRNSYNQNSYSNNNQSNLSQKQESLSFLDKYQSGVYQEKFQNQ